VQTTSNSGCREQNNAQLIVIITNEQKTNQILQQRQQTHGIPGLLTGAASSNADFPTDFKSSSQLHSVCAPIDMTTYSFPSDPFLFMTSLVAIVSFLLVFDFDASLKERILF
jgi:hypothetical protein